MKKFLAIFVVTFVAATVAFAGPRGGRGCGGGGCRPAPCRPCPPRPCPPRPYGPGCGYGYGWNCSRDLGNAAAITSIVANSLQAVSAVTCPVAIANPVAPVVVAQPDAVAVPAPVPPLATVHSPADVTACTPVGAVPVANAAVATAPAVAPAATPIPTTVAPVATVPCISRPRCEQICVSAPAPAVAPAVVAPYGRAGRVVYYGR